MADEWERELGVLLDRFHATWMRGADSDRLRAAIIAHARKGRESGWRTIESAPRDGTVIDVWMGNCDESERRFYCSGDTRRSPAWAYFRDKFRPAGGLGVPVFVEPTHWMPLPAVPAPSSETGKQGEDI